jgi:hypothetical protein
MSLRISLKVAKLYNMMPADEVASDAKTFF